MPKQLAIALTAIAFPTAGLTSTFVYPVGDPNLEPTTSCMALDKNTYCITRTFGEQRAESEGGGAHVAVDLTNNLEGGDVRAVTDGTIALVVTEDNSGGQGNVVVIRHNIPSADGVTYYSLYAHLQNGSISVSQDEAVTAGEKIAQVDCTGTIDTSTHPCPSNGKYGPHLHFAIKFFPSDDPPPSSSLLLGCGYLSSNCMSEKGVSLQNRYVDPIAFIQSQKSSSEGGTTGGTTGGTSGGSSGGTGATTLPDPPSAPNPGSSTSPGPSLQADSILLAWSPSAGADGYEVKVFDATTSTLVVDQSVAGENLSLALDQGAYFWQVRACNSVGCSNYTAPLYFQAIYACVAPSASRRTSPAATCATTFDLSVSKSGSGSGTVTSSPAGISCGSTCSSSYTVGTSVVLAESPAAGSTFAGWTGCDSVDAGASSCTMQMTSAKSVSASFKTNPAPAPSIGSVSPSSIPADTNLHQITVNGSNFSTSGGTLRFTDPNSITYNSTDHPDRIVSVSPTQWVYNLNDGGTVGTWHATVINVDGQASNSGSFNVATVTTAPAVPSGLTPGSTTSPGPSVSGPSVTLSWNASSGATTYIGDITDVSTGQSVGTINTSSTSATFALTAGRPYKWWVEACNNAVCSNPSATAFFQVQAAAVPTAMISASPMSVQAGGQTTLTWSSTSTDSCTASNGWNGVKATSGTEIVTVQTTVGTENFGLSCSGNGQIASTGVNVTVTATAIAPATPSGLAPGTTTSPGPTVPDSTVTLSWNVSSGATSYKGDISDVSTGATVGTIDTSGTSATFSLNQGKQYRWWVEACNAVGCSNQTSPIYFQTQAGPIPTATISANPSTVPAGSQTTLTWSSTNAASCTASNGWSGTKTTSGTEVVSVQATAGTENFGLSCSGNGQIASTGVNVTVTATATAPVTPSGLSPGTTTSPGPAISGTLATLAWSASSGATMYIGDITDVSTGQSVGTINTSSTSATFALTAGRPYKWWVEACNGTGCSNPSAVFYFQTQASTPSISTVSPNSIPSDNNLHQLTISGNNFSASGGHLTFTDPFGNTYSSADHPERVVSVSSTQWVYNINDGSTAGTWHVQIVNADGKTSNSGSFLVQ